jgi:hypothetical protein
MTATLWISPARIPAMIRSRKPDLHCAPTRISGAALLAELADVYVNDAFGTAHRAHASTEGVAHLLSCAAGRLMEREVQALSGILESWIELARDSGQGGESRVRRLRGP